MKQVLILNGDIEKTESTNFLINAYKKGAESAGATVKELAIIDLIFNPNKLFNNRQIAELEPDLQKSLQAIRQSQHVVLFCPVYVDHIPAKIKGFFDRLFMPDQIFSSHQNINNNFSGRSARIVSILDEATFKEWKANKKTTYLSIKKPAFEKCRMSPVLTNTIGALHSLDNHYSQKWLVKMEKFGSQLI
ncbi:NAD(P)H-dependent oxidoreductase [Pedobacter sp. BMA]|uniref:NAD(P)H-dependent oxidoreductase n=1 Tax=Pedobacter sp. BMA TaxID=1663685 RepID=UPI00069D218F|nr:NAD(P)H-dependent oxidoreductase [Pedobacter sp. BMA]